MAEGDNEPKSTHTDVRLGDDVLEGGEVEPLQDSNRGAAPSEHGSLPGLIVGCDFGTQRPVSIRLHNDPHLHRQGGGDSKSRQDVQHLDAPAVGLG